MSEPVPAAGSDIHDPHAAGRERFMGVQYVPVSDPGNEVSVDPVHELRVLLAHVERAGTLTWNRSARRESSKPALRHQARLEQNRDRIGQILAALAPEQVAEVAREVGVDIEVAFGYRDRWTRRHSRPDALSTDPGWLFPL